MESAADHKKVDSIFELREAVEIKVRAEDALAADGTPDSREALIRAQADVEAKTQEAIDACHECGEVHADDVGHRPSARIDERHDNLIVVNFGQTSRPA